MSFPPHITCLSLFKQHVTELYFVFLFCGVFGLCRRPTEKDILRESFVFQASVHVSAHGFDLENLLL